MIKRLLTPQGLLLLAAVMLLSACGVNLSGEPEIKNSMEIITVPTTVPTASPEPTASDATSDTASATDSDTTSAADTESTAEPAAADTDTLTLTGGDYDLGFEVYLRECAACHGAADGAGPGLKVMHDDSASRIDGMSAEDYVYQSIIDPGAYVVDGYVNMMPTDFGDSLTDDEIRGLITFVLEFDPARMGMSGSNTDTATEPETSTDTSAAAPDAAPTSEGAVGPAIEAENTLTVTGNLIAGTTDGDPIPADLPVSLYAVDPHGNLAGFYESVSTEDGAYTFENVARTAGMMYFIEVNYDGVPQGTSVAGIEGSEETVNSDIVLYERTTEPDTVAITWAEVLVNYAPVDQAGIEVWLDLELANTGDRIVTTDELSEPNNWYVSVVVELPVSAFGIQPMQTENSQRYSVDVVDGVPMVKDTWPLRPGQAHTITIAYYLPYTSDAVIEHGFNYTVMDGMVLLPNDTVNFESEQFDNAGVWRGRISDDGVSVVALEANEKIDPDKDFTLIKAHDLKNAITSDERMTFALDGRPTRTLNLIGSAASDSKDDNNNNMLALALGVLGVGIILLAGVLWWRQRQSVAGAAASQPKSTTHPREAVVSAWKMPGATASKDDLLAALAALDQAYDDDEIDESTYQDRRAQISERLLPLLSEDE